MARAALMVLILLVVMAYVSFFLAWNAAPTPITTWELGAKYTQDMPVGLLFIAGVLIGAVTMAVALWGPWQALKASDERQRALVDKAKGKLKSQSKEIKALTDEVEAVTGTLDEQARRTERPPELSSPEDVSLSEQEAAAVVAVGESDEVPEPQDESNDEPPDDPEVV